MILSNVEILKAIQAGNIKIDGLISNDPSQPPFNTSAVDLRLGYQIAVPKDEAPFSLDLTKGGIAKLLHDNSDQKTISQDQPYKLKRHTFILGQTIEKVAFPIRQDAPCYSARVEGKSSIARCGILVHFTAPTIHAGFEGRITLEIINLGPFEFLLSPEMAICQLIIEEVKGTPTDAPNQFKGQTTPSGLKQ